MARLKTQAQLEAERQEAARYALGRFELPLDRLLLVYARQSSTKQIVANVQSAKQQTVDLIEYGTELGWTRDGNADYKLFVEKAVTRDGEIRGVSGTVRISEREGLREVVEIINSGTAGAVLVVDISRLFRGEDLIDATVFANACKRNRVMVLTKDGESADVFDFNNPNKEEVKRFINEAAGAAEFVKRHIRGKMLANRSRKARRDGLLGNGLAPVGMSVVKEEVGERGWRRMVGQRLVPSVHAPNVNALYERYEALGASLTQLHKEIVGKPIFPDHPDIDPSSMFLTKVPGGWTVKSQAALKHILTNPVYIGHVVFDGRVVKRNAHPAIIDPDLWEFAFLHLSNTDLDGIPIERPERVARFTRKGQQTAGLLSGVREDGKPVLEGANGKHVYVQRNKSKAGAAYTIKDYHEMDTGYYDAGISVPELDCIFSSRLMLWLQTDAAASGQLYSRFTQLDETPEDGPDIQLQDDIEETRKELTSVARRLDVAGDLMEDRELRAAYSRKSQLTKRLAEVEHKLAKQVTMREELRKARQDLLTAPEKWGTWPIDRKQRFVRLVTQSIILEQVPESDGWLRMTICWCPLVGWSTGDVAFIWRQTGGNWTEEETNLLRTWYLRATKSELLHIFPKRSWLAISSKWSSLGLSTERNKRRSDTDLPDHMSVSDHNVLERYELRTDAQGQRVWWTCFGVEDGNYQTRMVSSEFPGYMQ
jgi:DNA invertase Pin-like site-specific DNA recombinase